MHAVRQFYMHAGQIKDFFASSIGCTLKEDQSLRTVELKLRTALYSVSEVNMRKMLPQYLARQTKSTNCLQSEIYFQ